MPTIGLFSQQYWNGNRHTNVVIPPLGVTGGGYPLWQSAVSMAIWGPPLDLLRVYWARLRWAWLVLRLLWAAPDDDRDWLVSWVRSLPSYTARERYVFDELRGLMASDTWPKAQLAVAQTATTLGFNEPKFWKGLSTMVHATPGKAAQHFRHLEALKNLQALGVSLSSHQMNLVIEAAYHDFTQIPKRTV